MLSVGTKCGSVKTTIIGILFTDSKGQVCLKHTHTLHAHSNQRCSDKHSVQISQIKICVLHMVNTIHLTQKKYLLSHQLHLHQHSCLDSVHCHTTHAP